MSPHNRALAGLGGSLYAWAMLDDPKSALRPDTLAAQAGHFVDPESGAVTPALHSATTFARNPDYSLIGDASYTRYGNPTYAPLEALLARLEGGAEAMVFSSGMSAAATAFQALSPGDHVVAQRQMYWALRNWLLEFCQQWGLRLDLFDAGDPAALQAAIKPGETKLVWIETPANPTWDVIDIAAAAEAAHQAGARLAVDSTSATPVLTRPLEHGADLVMHSATKYLNGHSDVLAGALITAKTDAYWQKMRDLRGGNGCVLGPFEAWLLLRGLRTLFIRVERASQSAMAIATALDGHPALSGVLYPGLTSHPGHQVAARQMSGGFGGMLSLRLAGGSQAALRLAERVRVFIRATSLGGVESLLEHRKSIEGADSPVPADLVRLSVGIENAADLIADLEQALAD